MGQASLPSISKIEEVLDLLTNPDKYTQYLKEFKRIHDSAAEMLGELAVKHMADAFLAQADSKLQEAVAVKRRADEALQAAAQANAEAEDYRETSKQLHITATAIRDETEAARTKLANERTTFEQERQEFAAHVASATAELQKGREANAEEMRKIELRRKSLTEALQHV